MNLPSYVAVQKPRIDRVLERLLPAGEGGARTVAEAMRYAVMGGGKRLRSIVALAAYEACGGADEAFLEPAAALEMIHTYSLIHDDLPAMDDDDLRRGRPTCHRVFGEAQAILAGDALLTLAFEILGSRPEGNRHASRRAEAVVVAARCAGISGMVGGQAADLEAQSRAIPPDDLRWIHLHKTGALFSASSELGALHAGAATEQRAAMAAYGEALGLAFQIVDDVLDRTGSDESLGKTPGKDLQSGKSTYPALFGLDESRRQARLLSERAQDTLRPTGLGTETLEALAEFAVTRVR